MFAELFPDMEFGSCVTSPLINEVLYGVSPGSLELLTLTRVDSVRRVYAADACCTPMDIRSSVNEGQAASGRILAELKTGGI